MGTIKLQRICGNMAQKIKNFCFLISEIFHEEQNIYALFNFELAENVNKSFEVIYTPSEIEGEIGTFEKKELKSPNFSTGIASQGFSNAKDYNKMPNA